jgi:SAM-dependent methyltransferase
MAFSRIALFIFLGGALLYGTAFPAYAQTQARKAAYLPYHEAQPILAALAEILPPELKDLSPDAQKQKWAGWLADRDGIIRGRLALGDEDSLVNFLLFGATYTKQPRFSPKQLSTLAGPEGGAGVKAKLDAILASRLNDLVTALKKPGGNERIVFTRQWLAQKGYGFATEAACAKAKTYLMASVQRVFNEQESYARTVEMARSGDASEEFAARSTLYRERGLSSDTSLRPDFALDEALRGLKEQNLLAPGGVRRVAIIGPGLDFTDKQDGYDFYPQQTIQPFAIIDSLLRLGLARQDTLQVTTLDLSPRINAHVARARASAQRGRAYTVQLPYLEQAQWNEAMTRYWQTFGDQIGASVKPAPIPAHVTGVTSRAVRIRSEIVARLQPPMDMNIVLQRLELPDSERFDLMIATNILVYYDNFEQSLALKNVERMLRPGGFLLSNNALLELPFIGVRSINYSTTVYSARPDDGDHIVWYQRQ